MTQAPWHLAFPFLAAVFFAGGNMALKRALQLGAGPLRALALTNLSLAAAFTPLALAAHAAPWSLAWQPALGGAAYFTGQMLNVLALRNGDVSLVTPLMGSKVVFVALFSGWFAAAPLGAAPRAAAALTALGVLVMGAGDMRARSRIFPTLCLALASAACFALCDMTLQSWSRNFGAAGFIAALFATVGAASAALWPARERDRVFDAGRLRRADRWLGASIAMTAFQSILISTAISRWGDATRVNVVYSLRALWGVAAVWLVGARFGNHERAAAGPLRMAGRLVGAVILIAAVLIAVAR